MRLVHIYAGLPAVLLLAACAAAQDTPPAPATTQPAAPVAQPQDDAPPPMERWNLYYQATSIGMYHGTFTSPYRGPLSLQAYPERDVSLTTTLFFDLNLGDYTQLYFNPEIAGGRGFSSVDGMANAS